MKCGIIILVNSFKEKTLNTAYPSPFVIFPTPKPDPNSKNLWILFNKAKSRIWSFIENWGVTFQEIWISFCDWNHSCY